MPISNAMPSADDSSPQPPAVRRPPSVTDRLLLGLRDEIHRSGLLNRPQDPAGGAPARFLNLTGGRAELAAALLEDHPDCRAVCHVFDVYSADALRRGMTEGRAAAAERAEIVCTADVPETPPVDLAILAVRIPRMEFELTRDLLQSAHEALRPGGKLAVAVDTPRDHHLHEELRGLFEKVTRRPESDGVAYLATKTAPLRKRRNFAAEFAFRDRGRLIRACSRPGVFSHRRLDGGARALLAAMKIRPGMQVLDLGCGCGAVGVAAALRAADVGVLAVDSNARAIACTRETAELNGVRSLATLLTADGSTGGRTFDLVLANPPYYSHFRIAELFVASARKALVPGGTLLLVTKTPDWYFEQLPVAGFVQIGAVVDGRGKAQGSGYTVIECRRGGASAGATD